MDLIEKYYQKVNDLIEEAKAEGVIIAPYSREVQREEGNLPLEGGIAVMKGEDYKAIITWTR